MAMAKSVIWIYYKHTLRYFSNLIPNDLKIKNNLRLNCFASNVSGVTPKFDLRNISSKIIGLQIKFQIRGYLKSNFNLKFGLVVTKGEKPIKKVKNCKISIFVKNEKIICQI